MPGVRSRSSTPIWPTILLGNNSYPGTGGWLCVHEVYSWKVWWKKKKRKGEAVRGWWRNIEFCGARDVIGESCSGHVGLSSFVNFLTTFTFYTTQRPQQSTSTNTEYNESSNESSNESVLFLLLSTSSLNTPHSRYASCPVARGSYCYRSFVGEQTHTVFSRTASTPPWRSSLSSGRTIFMTDIIQLMFYKASRGIMQV